MLSQERVRELLEYDPLTGIFTRRSSQKVAGSLSENGYVKIQVDGLSCGAHKLAWFYVYGEWQQIDHKDNIRSHNAISNLRKATAQQNAANRESVASNTSTKGVHFRKGRFEAGIKINQKRFHLGCFRTLEEAKAAYDKAAKEYFGEFARA